MELRDSIFGFVNTQRHVEFQKTFAGACRHGGRYCWKPIFVDDLSDELVDVMVDGIRNIPRECSIFLMETLGGATS